MNKFLKIAFITDMYSEKMGYSENFLPKAVAKLGHEVHVIASTAQIYFSSPTYKKTYEPFIGPNIVEPVVKQIDGYTLHRLPLKPRFLLKKVIQMQGLKALLKDLRPDIIQVFNIYNLNCYKAALVANKLNIPFFTESHIHASVFDMNNLRTKLKYSLLRFPSKLKRINQIAVKHYPIGQDVAELSKKYFYVSPEKIKLQSLGVDTDLFTPVKFQNQLRSRIQRRERLGFQADDFICIYTGRFTTDKNPQCLAQAIDLLQRKGHSRIKSLFVGSGTPEDIKKIQSLKGCIIHPFVKVSELPDFYRAVDIGIWPRQESMSQLDAAACGLPLILSDNIEVKERITGNGLLYKENDYADLAHKILELTDDNQRKKMSEIGIDKVKNLFSWDAIAKERIFDYNQAIKNKSL